MVWIVCDDAFFVMPLQEGTHHKLLAQDKNLNSASKVANWIVVDILKYLYLPLLISLANSFLLEMGIAKDPSYLSAIHVLSHSSLSFNFMF